MGVNRLRFESQSAGAGKLLSGLLKGELLSGLLKGELLSGLLISVRQLQLDFGQSIRLSSRIFRV